jgi:S-adenosylmethionine decarboxylase
MKKIAPDIFRQRLLIEGYYKINITRDMLRKYLLGIAEHLGLKTYGEPIIFSPESGMGKEENQGFDAFVPLIASGISAYVWSNAKFMSVVLYTCKGFDETAAIDYTRNYFQVSGELVHISF